MEFGNENFENSSNLVVGNKENEEVQEEIIIKKDETSSKTVKSILEDLRLTKRRKNKSKKPLTEYDVNNTENLVPPEELLPQKDEIPIPEHDENPLPQNDDNKEDLDQNQSEPEASNADSKNVNTGDKATTSKKSNKHKRTAAKRRAQKKSKKMAAAQSSANNPPNIERSVAVFDSEVYQEALSSETGRNRLSHDEIREFMIELHSALVFATFLAYLERYGILESE